MSIFFIVNSHQFTQLEYGWATFGQPSSPRTFSLPNMPRIHFRGEGAGV